MHTDFRMVALERERFANLFQMADQELAAHGARRLLADEHPGYLCRVSFVDAALGESVILTPFRHHDVASPYQSLGPIFVREAATTAMPEVNEVPPMLRHRLLSVRAYDANAMMKAASVVEGRMLEESVREYFADGSITYLHLHNARPGCFNCLVRRA